MRLSFVIDVVNRLPTWVSQLPDIRMATGSTAINYVPAVAASDVEGPVQYVAVSLPPGLSVDSTTGRIRPTTGCY